MMTKVFSSCLHNRDLWGLTRPYKNLSRPYKRWTQQQQQKKQQQQRQQQLHSHSKCRLGASGSLWEPLGTTENLWKPRGASGSFWKLWEHLRWEPLGASGNLLKAFWSSGSHWDQNLSRFGLKVWTALVDRWAPVIAICTAWRSSSSFSNFEWKLSMWAAR